MAIRPCCSRPLSALALSAVLLVPTLTAAQSGPLDPAAGRWQYAATIYAYLPTIHGHGRFPVGPDGSNVSVDADQIIDKLKFTVMGSFDAHNGRWGGFTDLLYLNVGGSKSRPDRGIAGPALATSADLDIKSTVWTLAGEYRLASDPAMTTDLLAGTRLLSLKEKLSLNLAASAGSRSAASEVKQTVWDAIVGVKTRYRFGRAWSVPFYADIGTGQSDLTWQIGAGISYAFGWGEASAMWRYLDYRFDSNKPVESLSLNGPMVGATFRW